jgi:sirohydrochlorin ferrochelatase
MRSNALLAAGLLVGSLAPQSSTPPAVAVAMALDVDASDAYLERVTGTYDLLTGIAAPSIR